MPGWLDEAESSFRFDRQGCGPGGAACTCCLRPSGLQQSLEEMEFMRSACAAAQEKSARCDFIRPPALL